MQHSVTLTVYNQYGLMQHNPFPYNFAVRIAGFDPFQYATLIPLSGVADAIGSDGIEDSFADC